MAVKSSHCCANGSYKLLDWSTKGAGDPLVGGVEKLGIYSTEAGEYAYVNLMWKAGRKKERYCAPNDSTIIQRGAAAAMTGPQDCVIEMRQVYQHRRDLAVILLKELGRYVYTPHGAFYILVDVSSPDGTGRRGRQFALDVLRERNIAVAPGSTFGSVAEHSVRVSLAASDDEIVRGVRELCGFADSY